ncbi:MAG: tetratricopeptide repeat protein, partial [Halothece sp.]
SQNLKRNDYSVIEKLKAAIQENPNDSESYKQLGMILAAQGKRQGAILYLERAKELFEDQGNTEQAEFMNQIIRNLIK